MRIEPWRGNDWIKFQSSPLPEIPAPSLKDLPTPCAFLLSPILILDRVGCLVNDAHVIMAHAILSPGYHPLPACRLHAYVQAQQLPVHTRHGY